MSTVDLPTVPRLTLEDLRRVNTPAVAAVLVVVLLAWACGLVVHLGDQARGRADRAAEQQRAASRVQSLAHDWSIERSFLEASNLRAIDARLGAVVGERSALAARRTAALADGRSALAGSAGTVDETQRARLAAALAVLAAPESVYSRITSETADVRRVAGEVSVAQAAARTAASQAAQQRPASAVSSAHTGSRVTPVARAAARPVAAPGGGSVEQVGEATLRSLPGNAGVTIHWNDPDLAGHLGAVWSGNTSYIMVNAAALAGNPGKTRDVVRHEITHIYQGRLAAANGLSWSGLGARMSAAFGANPQEKAADCVALRFGASWTHYTKDCGGAAKQAWVDGLIGGYLP